MISEGTVNQLLYTEKYNIETGIIRDKRVTRVKIGEVHYQIGIHLFDNIEYDEIQKYNKMYINYTGNEDYWADMHEVTLEQSEFNSVGLNYLHFKDERLKKSNPYIVKKVWIDFGGSKKPFIGFQQLYQDSIRFKVIGPKEDIEAIKAMKKFEEQFDIKDELERIRSYSGNDYHKRRKVTVTTISGETYEVTTSEDYDVTYEIWDKWHAYGKAMKASNRIYWLEEKLTEIEDKTFKMSELEKEVYKILAHQYGVTQYAIDEKYQLAEDMPAISKKNEVHPAEIWKSWYCYIYQYVDREIKWLEKQF